MSVKPIRDNVLVKRSGDELRTASGLHLVQNEKPSEGTVVAVGEGTITLTGTPVPLVVSVGDKVLLRRGSGGEVKVQGEDYLLVTERDILAIITE